MKAHLPPWPEPERPPDVVWVPDLSAYAPREDCELWRGREWRLRASCDAVRRYTAGIQPEALDSRTVTNPVHTDHISGDAQREPAVSPKTTSDDTTRDRRDAVREDVWPGP